MAKLNGWKKATLIGGAIIAVGGAITVGREYVPWPPKITFAIAAGNLQARLDNQLITLMTLEAQAKATGEREQERRLKALIIEKEREIKELEALKAKNQ